MVPLKLELKNFLSYGELQVIDFSQHNLICLSGKNGHGKSAILDGITWALWGQARKPGGVAKPDENLLKIGQTKLLVMFEFQVGKDVYRVRREFWKSLGKSNATLDLSLKSSKLENFFSLTDKTIRQTQKKLDSILKINYETFVNSAFLRQGNSNEFSKKSARERKVLLTKILGLDQYDLLQQKANDLIKDKNTQVKSLLALKEQNSQKIKLQVDLDVKLNQIQQMIKQTDFSLNNLKQTKSLLDEKKVLISSQIEEIKKVLDAKKSCELRVNDVQTKLNEALLIWEQNNQQILATKDPGLALQEVQDSENALSLAEAEWLKKFEIQSKISSQNMLLNKLFQTASSEFSKKKTDSMRLIDADKNILAMKSQEVLRLQKDHKDLYENVLTIEKRLISLQKENEALKQCPTCFQSVDDQHKINIYQQRSREALTQKELELKKIDNLLHQISLLKIDQAQVEKNLNHNKKMFDQLLQEEADWISNDSLYLIEKNKLLELESILSLIKIDQDFLANLKKQVAQSREVLSICQNIEVKKTEQKLWESRILELKDLLARDKHELSMLMLKLTGLDNIKQEYLALKEQWETIVSKLKLLEAEFFDFIQKEAEIKTQLKVCFGLENENKEIEAKIQSIKKDVLDLSLVSEAFGKNGIQALLLEEALPEIEAATNQILSVISETHAKVFIEPLKDLKKGGTKESLDIVISDINGIRDYEMFSGGEAFRIDFALRVGISQVIASRAGTSLKTLIIDEGFGALDEEGIMLMMNCLYKIADQFEKIIVVSHLPILKEMFPIHFIVSKDLQGSKVAIEYRG